jgi:hypothetical protein
MSSKHQAGKGSRYRPVDRAKWEENYERIFGKKKLKKDEQERPSNKNSK